MIRRAGVLAPIAALAVLFAAVVRHEVVEFQRRLGRQLRRRSGASQLPSYPGATGAAFILPCLMA